MLRQELTEQVLIEIPLGHTIYEEIAQVTRCTRAVVEYTRMCVKINTKLTNFKISIMMNKDKIHRKIREFFRCS